MMTFSTRAELQAFLAAANVAARRSAVERGAADVAEPPIGLPERDAEVHAVLLEAGAIS